MRVQNYLTQQAKTVTLLASLLMLFVIVSTAMAQEAVIRTSFGSIEKEPIPVNVLTGQSCLIIFDQPIGRLAVSNTDTAEAVVVAPNQMMINGKTFGRSRFTAWAKDGERFIFFDVDVRSNLAQIDSQVRALFPKEDIRLSQANGSVVISGNVDTKVATQVETVVQAAGFKTVNLLSQPIQAILQVQLQLRVAEVSRNKLSELAAAPTVALSPGEGGYVNTGAGPYTVNNVTNGNILGAVASNLNLFVMTNGTFTFLRALQQQGALRSLAEPNLVAMNGQPASFLAGGELPIPVVQAGGGNAVSIQYKEYGIRITFKPNILDEQHIRLEIESEVSALDYNNAVTLNGFLIPALRTRRAKTSIELRDGQSFGIAGLLDNSESRSLAKIPLISSVPVLGNLFKSKSFQKSESELVFITTAKITEPLNPDAFPNMKGIDGLKGSSPLGVENPAPQNNTSTSGSGGTGASTTRNAAPAASAGGSSSTSTGSVTTGAGVGGESNLNGNGSGTANSVNAEPVKSDSSSKNTPPAGSPGPGNGDDAKTNSPIPANNESQGGAANTAPEKTSPDASSPKVVTKHPAEGLNWKLRTTESSAMTAQQSKEKKQ